MTQTADRTPQDARPTRAEWIAAAAIGVLFVLLRLPLLFEPALRLGWNSDAAIFGLMAKAIAEGRELPVFFWGQSYMGPLTSFVAAGVGLLIGSVGPLALRLAAMLETAAAIAFYWAGLRRAFGPRVAAIVALWLAIGPAFLFSFTVAPIGAEQMFLLSALIFWFSVRSTFTNVRDWFVFGLLAGVGWWINQGVVFALGATLIVLVLRSEPWRIAWPYPHAGDRILMRIDRLQWRPLDRATRLLLRGINVLLLVDLVGGVLHELVPRSPAFFVFHPILEPFLAWIVYRSLTAIAFSEDTRRALALAGRTWRRWLPWVAAFLAGALLGYLPVIAGAFTHAYRSSYGLSVPMLQLRDALRHLVTFVRSDFWALIGAGRGAAVVVAILVIPLIVAIVRQRREALALVSLRHARFGNRAIAAMTIVLCLLFYVSSQRAYPGAARYIASALPMLYAFAIEEALRWRKVAAVTITVLVAAGLVVPRIADRNAVVEARAERYETLGGDFDPRPTLQTIASQGYRVCYAGYWTAYKLEWVSDGRVQFIPFHSYDRTPERSARLDALPVPKCFVDERGRVRRFDRAEWNDATSSKARGRLVREGAAALSSRAIP